MRKHIKKKLLELIHTLEMANQLLQNIIIKGDVRQLLEVLEEEQKAAIVIGEQIEESEGEGMQVVVLLEKYCELLWQMSQAETRKEWKFFRKQLVRQIKEIKSDIQAIQEQYHVVFLPYNASMWDCMESVWREASKDEECVCHVIPIPYYDILPDGTAGECHYEADRMPGYVPITHYEKYQLQEEHPDIIYIHNPYDNGNRVTSVAPDYYSSVLKNYTDMLVYIPYFIERGHMSQMHSLLPAYQNVDRIILQSECMLEDIDLSIPREKLLVLGSPKEERMIWMETHKEEIEMPDGWREKIGGKTVFFLNTSISSILNDGIKRLGKVEEVFDVVAGREDAALIWRPHPLLEATLQAMRPALFKKYRQLVKRFQREDLGILDMTADVERAVALSDGYIGESSSSVVNLFHAVCKPRLFLGTQKFYQPTADEMKSDSTYDICRVGDALWFITDNLQLLCKLDLPSGKLEVVESIPGVPEGTKAYYLSIVHYDGKLILVPGVGESLCIYDIETRVFTNYYYRGEYVFVSFGKAILHGHELFLTPRDYPALVSFDMDTCRFTYFPECIADMYDAMGVSRPTPPFLWGVSWHEDELYLAAYEGNCVLIFNMENRSYRIKRIGKHENAYYGMVSDEQYNWMITHNGSKVVRWARKTGEIVEYEIFPQKFEAGNIAFVNLLDFGDSLYLIPFLANAICRFDKNTNEISFVEFKLPYKENEYASKYYNLGGRRYKFAKKVSDWEIAALSLYDCSFVVMDVKTLRCKRYPLRVEDNVSWECRRQMNYQLDMCENQKRPLVKYIESVCRGYPKAFCKKGAQISKLNTENHIGERIHTAIKSSCILA